jgi:hypothetical protein
MTDTIKLVVAERRAAELLTVLQSAVNGDPHWRIDARRLLGKIDRLDMPEPMSEEERDRLREIDARKRAAEILGDVCNG